LNVLDDDAFAGVAGRLFGGGSDATFAEDVHGQIEVALRFRERFFGFPHAGIGHVAEFGHVGGGEFRHRLVRSLSVECQKFKR
jgi:hypothetical protein